MKIPSRKLNNGLILDFHDLSNRYFGDYHRLCIEVRCTVPLRPEYFADAADSREEFHRARGILGESVHFTRKLEKMGVSGNDLDDTRQEMIESFLNSSLAYLSSPLFPSRLIRRKLEGKGKIYPLSNRDDPQTGD